jgi:hypothetical protein
MLLQVRNGPEEPEQVPYVSCLLLFRSLVCYWVFGRTFFSDYGSTPAELDAIERSKAFVLYEYSIVADLETKGSGDLPGSTLGLPLACRSGPRPRVHVGTKNIIVDIWNLGRYREG